MSKIIDVVEKWLSSDNWIFERDSSKDIIRCGLKAQHASYRICFSADEKEQQLLVYVLCPVDPPDDKRVAMCEFLTRANFGLVIGNFEMDMNDGEIRYKVSMDTEGGSLTPIMVRNMLGAAVSTIDRYFPGIMAVIYSEQSAEDAVLMAEYGKRRSETTH